MKVDIFSAYLFIDLPEAFIAVMAGFAVFNLSVLRVWRKWTIFSLLHAVFTSAASFFLISYQVKIFLLFIIMNLLLYLVFRMKPWLTISISTSAFIFIISAEFFVLMIFQTFQINVEMLFQNPILLYSAVWLYLGLLLLLAIFMQKYQFDLRKLLPQTNQNRFLALLILVGGVELLLILSLNTSFLIERNNPTYLQEFISKNLAIYHLSIFALFIILVLLFWKYLSLTITRVEVETEKPYLQNIHDLLTAIRSIKHDGINHFTALDGLLKMEKYDLASDYIKHLLREATDLVHVVEGVKSPVVSALLHSKMAICVANHISFQIEINTELQFDQWRSKDLITILGNLLDNSIRATLHEENEQRYIRLEWGETETEQFLLIENSGPTIPPDMLERIFDLGYTTKTTSEGGVGLAVVKNTVQRYNGFISLFSQNGVTKFRIAIPK